MTLLTSNPITHAANNPCSETLGYEQPLLEGFD